MNSKVLTIAPAFALLVAFGNVACPNEMKSSSQDEPPYPWYDSLWLTKYQRAKDVIRRVQPETLPVFVAALSGLRTGADFRTKRITGLFDDTTMAAIRETITTFQLTNLEFHELKKFGRFVVHDHPFFAELQKKAIDVVSEAVGEPVEASYNFVSLYKKVGVCPVHMDAPHAKWTGQLTGLACWRRRPLVAVGRRNLFFLVPAPWEQVPFGSQ